MPDPVAVVLPSMGESVTEGTVSRWLKAVGDEVKLGEAVVEVTTDKVDVEVPAPSAGTLSEIVAAEGDTVAVGATLARITEGAAAAAAPEAPAGGRTGGAGGPHGIAELRHPGSRGHGRLPAAGGRRARRRRLLEHRGSQGGDGRGGRGGGRAGSRRRTHPPRASSRARPPRARPERRRTERGLEQRRRISPLARRAAAIEGLDPSSLQGSGPNGLVRRADIGRPPGNGASNGAAAAPQQLEGALTPLRGPAAVLAGFMEASLRDPHGHLLPEHPGGRARRQAPRAERGPQGSRPRGEGLLHPPDRLRGGPGGARRPRTLQPLRPHSGGRAGAGAAGRPPGDRRRQPAQGRLPLPGRAGGARRRRA